jgi:hypothetical protein
LLVAIARESTSPLDNDLTVNYSSEGNELFTKSM